MANVLQNIVTRARNWFGGSIKYIDPAIASWFTFSRAKISVNEDTADGVPPYFRAKQLIAENIASVDCTVYRRDGSGVVEATAHPLYRLLKFRPHPLYSSFVFWEVLIRHMLDRGEAFAYLVRGAETGRIKHLEIINERRPQIFQMDGAEYYFKFPNHTKPIPANDVLHFNLYSNDGVCGRGLLDLFRETLGRGIAEIQYTSAVFGNGAHPSGTLETDEILTQEQRTLLGEGFTSQYGGIDRLGRVAVLSHGLKFKPLDQKVGDGESKARLMTTKDISAMLGISPEMLGLSGETGITNIGVLNRMLVQYVFRVFAKRIEDEVNSKAFAARDWGGYFIKFDLNELLRGDPAERAKWYESMYKTQAINPNEIRERENLNPYEGGDEYGKPMATNIKTQPISNEPTE